MTAANEHLEPNRQHPLQRTIDLGEGDLGDYVLRLRWQEPDPQYGVLWVDFELIEITGLGENGERSYQQRGAPSSPEFTDDIEQAEIMVEGFLKWDGCMQFRVAYVHVDDMEPLKRLGEALVSARIEAARAMGDHYLCREELEGGG